MELTKPAWLVYAVDIAQILSAIGTTAAVIVAIYLARKAESQRPRFFAVVLANTVDGNPSLELFLQLTVVNAGVLPIVIKGTTFVLNTPGHEWRWHFGPLKIDEQYPRKIEHGQQVSASIPFYLNKEPWDKMRINWLTKRRMRFEIETTLGRTYVHRPNRHMRMAMKRSLEQYRNAAASNG